MGFQVSPGVQVKEIDLTNVIPAVSTSIGAIAGAFQWGPVGEIITVGSEKQLVSRFGKPNNDTFSYFMPAASFLKYGKSLRVVRADADIISGTAALNASSGTTNATVSNDDHFDDGNLTTLVTSVGSWIAKFPGDMGNGLTVNVIAKYTAQDDIINSFDTLPDPEEIHVAVIDSLGNFGQPGEVIETFAFLSTVEGTIGDDGTNNYYVDVINATSNYIRSLSINFSDANTTAAAADSAQAALTAAQAAVDDNTSTDQQVIDDLQATLTTAEDAVDATLTAAQAATDVFFSNSLTGGTNTPTLDLGDLKNGFDLFTDTETVDVNLIIQGPANANRDLANHLIALAATRKDCVAFVSPPIATTKQNPNATTDLITWADGLTSSSYGVIDSTALYVYDKYNDVYRWIAASGAVAGLCAKTDDVADPWWSPAGFNRGQLFGVTKLAFNPKHFERDDLYKKRINPIVTFPGEGTLLYGDKTAQSKPSAFDRINVRRLFIVLEKAIATAAKYQLFEFNDEFTRAQFRNMVEPFLRDVKGRRGLYDFHVVCDETNNTGQVIDTNRFIADIYIKPARSINFMTLNFIATRTGVEFSEIIGK